MAYLGNIPAEKYSSLTQQTFSSPTGTNFVLSQSVTNSADIALFVDNVRQDPTTYTAVGTALTTSTISSPSTMYCLYNGRTTETISPASGSVDSSQIVAGAVDDSHISGLAASKLTGSLPASMNEITKSSSDPTISTNPAGGVGTVYLNTTSGDMYSCTDATAGSNVWTRTSTTTYITATGGTITTDGDFKVHTFTSSGTFTPTIGNVLSGGDTVDYLVIAGGGAGGSSYPGAQTGSGGGGAGGYLTSLSFTISAQAYAVTVGAGGAGSASVAALSGTNSSFSTATSIGGGRGGSQTGSIAGLVGGSGGGAGAFSGSDNGTAGAGTVGQGYAGGTAVYTSPAYGGGGGGGSSAVGVNGTSSAGGNGGAGTANSITGSAVTRAGGGGAGTYTAGTLGIGGSGGGGASARGGTATAGTTNTGSGGGGNGGANGAGGAGGSGVVIIRYRFQA
jgi:hypothetical protein